MGSTQIIKTDQRVANIRSLLERSKSQMEMALPKHMTADRLLRIAMTSVQKTPKLLDCTPQSLIGAVMQAAQLGLEPDGVLGQAYLVPYKATCQLIPGYKGLLKLARNSGELSTIQAHSVHANDKFDFGYGLEPFLQHTPALSNPGEVIAFYAVARLKDGGYQFEVMSKHQVDATRARSMAANNGPWVTDYEEMGKKTVIRRLCKMLPASVELVTALSLDERADAGLSQDIDSVFDIEVEAEEVTDEGAAKSALDAVVDEAETAPRPKAREAKPESAPESATESKSNPVDTPTPGAPDMFDTAKGDPFKK